MNETELKAKIVNTLKRAGACPVTVWQGPLSRKGVSDLLVCLDGRFIAVEVKKTGGRPTPEQIDFIREVERAGGIGMVVDSVDAVIDRLDLGPRLFPLFNGSCS